MKLRYRLLLCCLGSVGLASALPVQAFGLLDAYTAAREYDPQFRAAWYTREAGLQEERIARAQLLPQVALTYGYNRNWLDQDVENPNGQTQHNSNSNYPSYAGQVQVRQPLLNMAAWAGYRQGQAISRGSESEFDGRHQELMLRLYEVYSAALLARDQLAIADAQRTALAEQMRANDQMFKAGEGTRTDMIETRSRHDVAQAQVIEARDALSTAMRQLAGIMGPGRVQSVDQLDQLVPKFSPSPSQVDDIESWVQLGLTNNAQVMARRYSVQAADAQVDGSRAGHYPTVDLVASHSRSEADTVSTLNQRNRSTMVGVQLRVPLYSGGATSATTTKAVANYDRAQAELDAVREEVAMEIRRQYALIQSGATKIRALESAVASASLLVEATRKSVAGGTRVNLDVLNAEQQLYTSRRDLAQARYDYLNAYMQLRYYAGVLTIDDLQTVSRYFAPGGKPGAAYASSVNGKTVAAQ